jgi:two-component system, probable response regulator PhcQ
MNWDLSMNLTLEPATRGGTILFVDDEPLSLKYFKASVGKYAKVLTASSPDAALKILASDGDAISVVVSDERMPFESGVSFLSDVRKSWPSTVRILTSAYANIDNLQQAINGAAIYRFVPKPWDLDELCTAMQEALAAERAAEKLAQRFEANPFEGRVGSGDAQQANIELLAVLARELAEPLGSIDNEAFQLAMLTGTRAIARPPNIPAQMATWSTQLRFGQIATSATRLQRDVEYCQSLTSSIAELASGLSVPGAVQTPSMAETASEALEQIAARQGDRRIITLDARQDFRYRAPKKIMGFVLSNLLHSALKQAATAASREISVELVSGFDCNEVRITTKLQPGTEIGEASQHGEFDRANRCALWAFGGELVYSCDKTLGRATTSVRLPTAELTGDLSPSH